MRRRAFAIRVCAVVLAALSAISLLAATGGGLSLIRNDDLEEWLSYIASDELEGRAVFTTGIGLAAAYIEDHLRAWGAKPAGDQGGYLQTVRVLGVRTTSRSTVTVEVGGESRTFADGQGVTFPRNAGGKQTVTVDRVEFAGYGLDAPGANHNDFRGRDVKGAAVVWLGSAGPKSLDAAYRRLLTGRNRYAIDELKAAAAIGVQAAGGGRGGQLPAGGAAGAAAAGGGAAAGGAAGAAQAGGAGGGAQPGAGRGNQIPAADFTTVQRLDALAPPSVTASDAFLEFLFSRAPTKYDELKRLADAQEPLPVFRLDGVKLTFNIEADYEVVRTRLTKNVVAIVEGSDPQLKDSYVVFGAHYDHVGYAEGEVAPGPNGNGTRRIAAPGRVTPGAEGDRIWNGADDDGSGIVSVMALAKAFAQGPRPRRSLLFIWHAGEESGLWGSRYFADYPTVPIGRIAAALNIDMVGRNRDDKISESNTVYLVGSDRISTELHEINRGANGDLPRPMTLNYEFNDPSDVEQLYTRSDHYSYASKGIPVIFFTTGLHPDYHTNTDHVSKIEFDKLMRITQLVYETGWRVADLDHAPARDNRGPRAGKATR